MRFLMRQPSNTAVSPALRGLAVLHVSWACTGADVTALAAGGAASQLDAATAAPFDAAPLNGALPLLDAGQTPALASR
jgi:hypothetical protein